MTEVDPVRLPPRLAARFRLEDVIGHGAGSVVHSAHDDLLDRDAVVKIVSVAPRSAATLGRFAALDHPHLVPVFDVEIDEQADGGPRAVIVTDPSGGGNLRSRLVRGPLDLVDALVCTAAVADALDHAHRAGVAHLAVAPENVLFDDDGRARLADTGLAAVTARSSESFLAPEQRDDEQSAGLPADVHALGLVLVTSLTGRDDPRHEGAEPLPDAVPDEVRAVLDRMLAEDPAARPLASEVTVALRRAALAVEPAAAVVVPVRTAGTRTPGARTTGSPVRPPVPRGLLLVAASAVVALLAGTVVLASTGPVQEIASDTPPPVSAAPAPGAPVPPGPTVLFDAEAPGAAGRTRPAADPADDADADSGARPSDEAVAADPSSPTPRSTASTEPRVPTSTSATPTDPSTPTGPTGASPTTDTAAPAPSSGTSDGQQPTTAPAPSSPEPDGNGGARSPGLVVRLLDNARTVL